MPSLSGADIEMIERTCAICLGSRKPGNDQVIFTAECSHSFYFSCIANSVKHGNYLCPICRCKWKEIPLMSSFSTDTTINNAGRTRVSLLEDQPPVSLPLPEPLHFSDDEPLPSITVDQTSSPSTIHSERIVLRAFSEFPVVAASEAVSRFVVLVGVRAPPLADDARHRAPIDLVTALDVSGNMAGSKLAHLKQAVCFVIDNLGPSGHLAIVTFSSGAQRNFPLQRMIEQGRREAAQAINSISANGGTNIVERLKKGVRVLEERREMNPVASIVLLSDGRDTYNGDNANQRHSPRNRRSSNATSGPEYLNLLPSSICPRNSEALAADQLPTFHVHTFGFGLDHDSSAMHAISDASGGTLSIIEIVGTVKDAFAMCIGSLRSVVAQELKLTVRSASRGVKFLNKESED
nr:E3 ubiquitin-protein ligase WAV3-like [Nicotiana tomentosiformis]